MHLVVSDDHSIAVDAWTISFSPDSRFLATGSHSGKINLFGVESGRKEESLDIRGGFTLSIAYVSISLLKFRSQTNWLNVFSIFVSFYSVFFLSVFMVFSLSCLIPFSLYLLHVSFCFLSICFSFCFHCFLSISFLYLFIFSLHLSILLCNLFFFDYQNLKIISKLFHNIIGTLIKLFDFFYFFPIHWVWCLQG